MEKELIETIKYIFAIIGIVSLPAILFLLTIIILTIREVNREHKDWPYDENYIP